MAEHYQRIVFVQGDEAAEVLDGVLSRQGVERTVEYLTQQYTGEGAPEISDSPSAGRGDDTARVGDYLLTWNLRRGYIGLERVMPPCPGCVGRGTGAVCCVCGGQVPASLRRRPGDPSEVRAGCPDCAAGRGHVHVPLARDGSAAS